MIYWLVCSADECPGIEGGTSLPSFLSTSEREIWVPLTFPKRRREWLLGRWTAKRLLQLCSSAFRALPLDAITVGNDADGAPYLSVDGKGRLPVSLSISHRGARAFCALSFSPSLSVGADIERVEPRIPAFVSDFFTSHEAGRVWACAPGTRDLLVSVVWSAKEAVLKALRQGLRVDTRRVEIGHVAGIAPRRTSPTGWHEVRVSSELPGTAHPASWWRSDGNDVLTLAVVSSGE
jgi:4'-phosphopantetheinyl transferase